MGDMDGRFWWEIWAVPPEGASPSGQTLKVKAHRCRDGSGDGGSQSPRSLRPKSCASLQARPYGAPPEVCPATKEKSASQP